MPKTLKLKVEKLCLKKKPQNSDSNTENKDDNKKICFDGKSDNEKKFTGNSSSLAFTEKTGADNPFNGIDVGTDSRPDCDTDFNGDGKKDCVIGNGNGTLKYFLNTGSSSSPAFIEKTGTDNPLNGIDVGTDSSPDCGTDFNGDGKKDCVVGNGNGTLKYFLNTGTSSSPAFTEKTGTDNPLNGVDVGSNATPDCGTDFNGDGKKDCVIGNGNGTLKYFLNTGISSSPPADLGKLSELSNYDITETVYNTGVFRFDSEDLKFWIGKNRNDFLEKYVNDAEFNIKRSNNVLEMYYNGIDFNGNFKEKDEDIIFDDNGNKIGRRELSNVPLYDKKDNKKIGIAEWYCIENIVDNITYINCSLVYFLDRKFLSKNISSVNSNISDNSGYSTCKFNFNYISRPGSGTFFVPGDYFVSKGFYSFENGLNRSSVINNIYIPFNSKENRRSIILHFNKLDSNNFLPQENYGIGNLGNSINMD